MDSLPRAANFVWFTEYVNSSEEIVGLKLWSLQGLDHLTLVRL